MPSYALDSQTDLSPKAPPGPSKLATPVATQNPTPLSFEDILVYDSDPDDPPGDVFAPDPFVPVANAVDAEAIRSSLEVKRRLSTDAEQNRARIHRVRSANTLDGDDDDDDDEDDGEEDDDAARQAAEQHEMEVDPSADLPDQDEDGDQRMGAGPSGGEDQEMDSGSEGSKGDGPSSVVVDQQLLDDSKDDEDDDEEVEDSDPQEDDDEGGAADDDVEMESVDFPHPLPTDVSKHVTISVLDANVPQEFEEIRDELEAALLPKVNDPGMLKKLRKALGDLANLGGFIPKESVDQEVSGETMAKLVGKLGALTVSPLPSARARRLTRTFQLGKVFTSQNGSKLTTSVVNDTVVTALDKATLGYGNWDWHERFQYVGDKNPVLPLVQGRIGVTVEVVLERVDGLMQILLVRGIDAPSNPMIIAVSQTRRGFRPSLTNPRQEIPLTPVQEMERDGFITRDARGPQTAFPSQWVNSGAVKFEVVQGQTRLELTRGVWKEYSPLSSTIKNMLKFLDKGSLARKLLLVKLQGVNSLLTISRFWPVRLVWLGMCTCIRLDA